MQENNIDAVKDEAVNEEALPEQQTGFRFFKNCSASLKRFSVLIFAINIFFIVIAAVLAVVLIAVNLGGDMLSLLAVPILTVAIVLVVLSRFFSAVIYGFAEIVEKYEK